MAEDQVKAMRRLIDAAIACGQNDRRAWRYLRAGLVKWADGNEAMRTDLLAELVEIGKGKKGESQRPPIHEDIQLVIWVDECESLLRNGMAPHAAPKSPIVYAFTHIHDSGLKHNYPADVDAFRTRVKAARRRCPDYAPVPEL